MNKTYRSIFNELTGTWVAVPEVTKAKGKKSRLAKTAAAVGLASIAASNVAQAQLIIGADVPTGNDSLSGGTNASVAQTLNQSWGGFRSALLYNNNVRFDDQPCDRYRG